ncbi:MAG: DUF3857 and transglutaminase domain-containing protein [Gammaproteobacteria bacterium]|nr:DUF3857 and transglutaminase domain-containing protein [Gammaproteobacteria bacterium]MCH9744668.1 DUF3857 and transglutaminase domain-containing protein [Gammaproteobacteria bacterium]
MYKLYFYLLYLLIFPVTVLADSPTTILSQKINIIIYPNTATTTLSSVEQKLNTAYAAKRAQQARYEYFPQFQTVKVIKAYLLNSQGNRIPINKKEIFTSPAPAAKDAPGFTKKLVKTVVYPQLIPGDITFIEWKVTNKRPTPFGFNFFLQPDFNLEMKKLQATIKLPAKMPIYWHASKAFKVTSSNTKKTKTITVSINDTPAHKTEPNMISPTDLLPYFEITTTPTWHAFGDIWWQFYKKQFIVTPEVKAKALAIANGATGRKALFRFYNWITNYINYINVASDVQSNYIPHTPQEILNNGYGDCKDYVMLLMAFAKSVGIDVQPAMINWGLKYRHYPIPTTEEINHAIAYAPQYKLFLNPTNIYATFGTLDTELRGKKALILGPHSKVMGTPPGQAAFNKTEIKLNLHLKKNKSIIGTNNIYSYGSLSNALRQLCFDKGLSGFFNFLARLTPDIIETTNIHTTNMNQLTQPLHLSANLSTANFIIFKQKAYFPARLGYNIGSRLYAEPYFFQRKRLYPLVIGAKKISQIFSVQIPAGYTISHLPNNYTLTNSAGNYSISYTKQPHAYQLHETLTLAHDIYLSSQYTALKKLLLQLMSAPRAIIVLTKSK